MLKSIFTIQFFIAGFAFFLLSWALWEIFVHRNKQRRIGRGYWLGLLVALTCVSMIFCIAHGLVAGLGHSEELKFLWPFRCFLTFLIVAVFPMLGLRLALGIKNSRLSFAFLILFLAPLPFSITTITPGISGRVLDEERKPVEGAYVYYEQMPAQPGPHFGYGLLRTDRSGNFTLSLHMDFHIPFFYSMPFERPVFPDKLSLVVYAPVLNNYCRIEDGYEGHSAQEGLQLDIEGQPRKTDFVLFDMSGRPEEYYASLHELFYSSPIRRYLRSPAEKGEFIDILRGRYRQFLGVYGNAVRDGHPVEGKLQN